MNVDLPDESIEADMIYEDLFKKENDDWFIEGTTEFGYRNNRFYVDGSLEGDNGWASMFCKKEFSGDSLVEYRWRIEESENCFHNLNFFLFTTMADGSSIIPSSAERTGTYGEYHVMNNYIYTYLCENDSFTNEEYEHYQKTRCRFRKDPGFHLVDEVWKDGLIEKHKDYHFKILIRGDLMKYYVNGEKIFEYHDSDNNVHRKGLHGFRPWHTSVSIDLFRVSKLK